MADVTASAFVDRLRAAPRRADGSEPGPDHLGLAMGTVFNLAKEYLDLPLGEVEVLLDESVYEARVGALSIMDKKARRKRTGEDERRGLYELYLRRMDRIDDWGLVDLGAQYVIGGYLLDKPRDELYRLARSENVWERRTAIWATMLFVRRGDLDDMYAISELLVDDPEHFVQTVVGGMLRTAGDHDAGRLRAFLDRHAATMPRTALRYSIEHLGKPERDHYLSLARAGTPGR
ncbi:DNA alkylation repair protein [Amorphoplanes digitatis]|uniref:3-methyladenine DNA glycosylase AlkD n=1 Tax=Actinoplanes digitatis TaxID=1868 RepID=A0A7W7MSB8_9ACTN|nr:DNA alkylation repair protein [Actinoplanes digitatis]MBB4764359.1 3-methyladenine DNA glycosylase AlkD [Actinoplanes digitatis]GID94155.1 DNA alkylation repair protein [Actinoplanes digitatis]